MLKVQEQRARHNIVTLNESWSYYCTHYESIWLRPGAKVSERTRVTVQREKLMVTMVWNPTGFHVICVLPKGCKFNNSYYQSEILEPFSEW
jgi:hypothetical protein